VLSVAEAKGLLSGLVRRASQVEKCGGVMRWKARVG